MSAAERRRVGIHFQQQKRKEQAQQPRDGIPALRAVENTVTANPDEVQFLPTDKNQDFSQKVLQLTKHCFPLEKEKDGSLAPQLDQNQT
ncbi:hypothetical protein GN956_G15904 [Arapaima gigas]